MRLGRRRGAFKFTEKKQSKQGMAALAIAVCSLAIFVAAALNSFWNGGAGSMYLGSAGVVALLLAVAAFGIAIQSLRDENAYKLFPYLATVVSFLAAGLWISLYVIGFLG